MPLFDYDAPPMRIEQLDYELPQELIAQHPVTPRDASRLLVVERQTGRISHHIFRELPQFLNAGDCLVINQTRVMPYRLLGSKVEGGARIELLLQEQLNETIWIALAYRSRRLRPGIRVHFGDDLECEVLENLGGGRFVFQFHFQGDFLNLLERYGEVPLPPYVERPGGLESADRERYQTVYAETPGSSAAPTAGLHFTPELMNRIISQGIDFARITLDVGQDTFQPVLTEFLEQHKIHSERYAVSREAAEIINTAHERGGRIIAVGTTSVRTLETLASSDQGGICPGAGTTRLYILPGYPFKMVQAMITNFHLPRTTLLALIAAFMGGDLWRLAYEEAIKNRYRFYSFGDAMLIL